MVQFLLPVSNSCQINRPIHFFFVLLPSRFLIALSKRRKERRGDKKYTYVCLDNGEKADDNGGISKEGEVIKRCKKDK